MVRGIRTLQASIAHQEQVVTESINGVTISEDKDFQEAVNAMVDRRLKATEVEQAKQLEELRANQQEMLRLLKAAQPEEEAK